LSITILEAEAGMKYWRMSFRIGDRGYEMWPDCYERGIAALTYHYRGKPVVGDCSKITEEEYDEIWRRKRPKSISARISLKNVAYKMREGNIIYAKQGAYIVGKGVVVGRYEHDPDILKGTEAEWEHFVRVKWEPDFPKFKLNLEANQYTVLELKGWRLRRIREMERRARNQALKLEAVEGEEFKSEATFRARNRALIDIKKANSNYTCEVCNMSFERRYGSIGKKYIIAHHVAPIGRRKKRGSKTSLEDIALVCANCHVMLHRTEPPLDVQELRHRLRKR
jgi:predicted HNH restriction endonuclease